MVKCENLLALKVSGNQSMNVIHLVRSAVFEKVIRAMSDRALRFFGNIAKNALTQIVCSLENQAGASGWVREDYMSHSDNKPTILSKNSGNMVTNRFRRSGLPNKRVPHRRVYYDLNDFYKYPFRDY